jgi:hypothetical protein
LGRPTLSGARETLVRRNTLSVSARFIASTVGDQQRRVNAKRALC